MQWIIIKTKILKMFFLVIMMIMTISWVSTDNEDQFFGICNRPRDLLKYVFIPSKLMPLALMNISVNLAAQQYNVFKITVLFSKSTLIFRFVVNIEFPLHCTGFQYIPVCLYEHIICILFLNIHPLKVCQFKIFSSFFLASMFVKTITCQL